MADATGTYDIGNWVQAGLSTGESVVMPYAAAVWRRAVAIPFNVQSPLAPVPVECQIWPTFAAQPPSLE
jgi:hypothetical protein